MYSNTFGFVTSHNLIETYIFVISCQISYNITTYKSCTHMYRRQISGQQFVTSFVSSCFLFAEHFEKILKKKLDCNCNSTQNLLCLFAVAPCNFVSALPKVGKRILKMSHRLSYSLVLSIRNETNISPQTLYIGFHFCRNVMFKYSTVDLISIKLILNI